MRASGAIPVELLDDPLFQDAFQEHIHTGKQPNIPRTTTIKHPIRWHQLAERIQKTPQIRKLFRDSYQASWCLAAVMGLQEAVLEVLGNDAAYDAKCDHGLGVEHNYAIGGHVGLCEQWLIKKSHNIIQHSMMMQHHLVPAK